MNPESAKTAEDVQETPALEYINRKQEASLDVLETAHLNLTNIEQHLFGYTSAGEQEGKDKPKQAGVLNAVADEAADVLQSAAMLQSRIESLMHQLGAGSNKVAPIGKAER